MGRDEKIFLILRVESTDESEIGGAREVKWKSDGQHSPANREVVGISQGQRLGFAIDFEDCHTAARVHADDLCVVFFVPDFHPGRLGSTHHAESGQNRSLIIDKKSGRLEAGAFRVGLVDDEAFDFDDRVFGLFEDILHFLADLVKNRRGGIDLNGLGQRNLREAGTQECCAQYDSRKLRS